METMFLRDPQTHTTLSYSDLLHHLNHPPKKLTPVVRASNLQELVLTLLLSLLADEPITLLDTDFSKAECEALVSAKDQNRQIDLAYLRPVANFTELKDRIFGVNRWRLGLFTSGTTGLPKQVHQTLESLTRGTKIKASFADHHWGLAYNPTHIAGIQVFFQALLNQNPMTNLYGLCPADQLDMIQAAGVTHLSATPTFFRLLLPTSRRFPKVQRLTFGGEKFDAQLANMLQNVFPSAKITNVYASTELGSILASEDDIFRIKPDQIGTLKIEDHHLLVHTSLLGESPLFDAQNEWYHTGDRVEILSESPLTFRFIGRSSEMINIGGNKVNPHEVEEAILKFPDIVAAKVYGQPNSVLGTVLCCDYVTNNDTISEKAIRLFLKGLVQPFKIPRLLQRVPALDTTRTGKLKRL